MAKHRRSRYEPGRRASTWLKVKVRPEQELVVGGWTPGEGTAKELGALVVGVYDGERLRFAGKVGSGFDGRTRKDLRARLEALETDVRPPSNRRRRRTTRAAGAVTSPACAGSGRSWSSAPRRAAGLATATYASPPTRGWNRAGTRGRSCASAPLTRRRPSAMPGPIVAPATSVAPVTPEPPSAASVARPTSTRRGSSPTRSWTRWAASRPTAPGTPPARTCG